MFKTDSFGLKIQIKEILRLFKEIIFFETKENGVILMKTDKNSFEIQQ